MLAVEKKSKKPLHEYKAATVDGKLLSHYGIDATRYNNVSWLEENLLLTCAGKFVLFIDFKSGKVETQDGPCDGAVGVTAVHPSRKSYVVGERCPSAPRVCVYEWPSKSLQGHFEGGATVGFCACDFDSAGEKMVTVASGPDFTIAVWDWQTRSMILRNKCFSADVFSVRFSAFDSSLLTTGGAGHIKFWTMSQTFTGLKLQGTLGKFGRLEISNVSGFVQFPDGKVLSGSENGCLLMWEGDLVKTSFALTVDTLMAEDGTESVNFTPCHVGAINAVSLIHDMKIAVSAGDDGFLRYWDREELDLAEGAGLTPMYAPKCLLEVKVGNLPLRSMTHNEKTSEWVLLSSNGCFCNSPFPSLEEIRSGTLTNKPSSHFLSFNGQPLTASAICPDQHAIVTGGEDGVIRVVDYVNAVELSHISSAALQLPTAPTAPSPVVALHVFKRSPTRLVAATANGFILLLEKGKESLSLLGHWKPHSTELFSLAVSADEQKLCTISAESSTVFFFEIQSDVGALQPVGFCLLPLRNPTAVEWDEVPSGGGCLVGFETGELLSLACPALSEVDHSVGYEFSGSVALIGLRQRRLPPPVEDDGPTLVAAGEDLSNALEEEDNGPWPIVLLKRLPNGNVAIGMHKEELVYEYRCSVRYPGLTQLPPLPPTGVEPPNYVEDPGQNLCYRDMMPLRAFVGTSKAGNELLMVCEGSKLLIRPLDNVVDDSDAKIIISGQSHDTTYGEITGAFLAHDGSMVVTTGTDGLVVTQLRGGYAEPATQLRLARNITSTVPSVAALVAPVDAGGSDDASGGNRAGSASSAGQAAPRVASASLKTLRAEEAKDAVPVALSIQEQKEADDAAEVERQKQLKLEAFVNELRVLHEEFAGLLQDNSALPKDSQVPADQLLLDPTLKERLNKEKAARVAEARKEFIVETARENLRTQKLKNRFVDNLLYDRIVLHSFSGECSVSTFRTVDPQHSVAKIQQWIQEAEGDATESEEGDDEGQKAQDCNGNGLNNNNNNNNDNVGGGQNEQSASSPDGGGAAVSASHAANAEPSWGGTTNGESPTLRVSASVKQQLDKKDERRREREQRKAGYDELLRRRPDPLEDERLLDDLIAEDVRVRGECVLRSDPNYVSERDYRPTAAAKLRRMIKLEHARVEMRSAFNEKLLALRERKRTAVAEINTLRARIAEINNSLHDSSVPSAPVSLTVEEEPERQFEMTRDALDAFAKEQAEAKAREEEARKAQRGFGADLAGAGPAGGGSTDEGAGGGRMGSTTSGDVSPRRDTSTHRRSSYNPAGAYRRSSRQSTFGGSRSERASRQGTMFSMANRERMDVELKMKLDNIKKSELEEEEGEMVRQTLQIERSRLDKKVRDIAAQVDKEVMQLVFERAELDSDICMADAHLLLLFREYQMLLVYSERDSTLRKQLADVRRARENNSREINAGKKATTELEQQQTRIQERTKDLKKEAEEYIHQNGPADRVTYLLKIYNRHIKRRRNNAEDEDNDDITSDEDDEDELDDGIIEEVCPPNCAVEVWEKVLAFRERRLDLNDELADCKEQQEKTRKLVEQKSKSVDTLEGRFAESQKAIVDLEKEKKKQLNLLNTIVSLRSSKIKSLNERYQFPFDLQSSDVVVVDESELERLRNRITELAEMKQKRRGVISDMSAELHEVQQEKNQTKKLHAEWEAKVSEIMMLKFGRLVDLEMLESCGNSRRIEMEKEQLRRTELKWQREVRKSENKIADLRDRLQNRLIHNTHLLQDFATYETDKHVVDKSLSKVTQKTVQQHQAPRVATKNDKMNLRDLICAQQEEIDALNAEIMMLKRKGGHAYSPSMY